MPNITGYIVPLILALIVVIILIKNIRVVPQAQAYVIERLGAYSTTWHVGLHFKIPFIETISKKVSLKEQVADFAPQPVITKDNVSTATLFDGSHWHVSFQWRYGRAQPAHRSGLRGTRLLGGYLQY